MTEHVFFCYYRQSDTGGQLWTHYLGKFYHYIGIEIQDNTAPSDI